MELNELVEKIKIEFPNLYSAINDINYKIKIKNKEVNREQRIIMFGNKDRIPLINKNVIEEFFIDITFKIIPPKFRPYKLFVLSGIKKNDNIPYLLAFILIKYLDNISYERIFHYLYENYEFQPKIIHSDFEKAIQIAIKNYKNFNKNIIHSRCLFHYSKMIRGKLAQAGLCKKKLNILSIEIISNLEIMCFIKIKNIKKFQEVILAEISKNNKLKNFKSYLKNYLFKLEPNVYNYSQLIEYFKKNNENKYLTKLYTTNNIIESINSKLNFYIPKKVTSNYSFVKSISKVLINDQLKDFINYRKDYKTKALINLIEDLDFNNNIHWISYDIIKKYLKLEINKNMENISEKELNLIYENILDLEEKKDEEKDKIEDNINNKEKNEIIDANDILGENNISYNDNQNEQDNEYVMNIEDIYENKYYENFEIKEDKNVSIDNFDNMNYISSADKDEKDKIISLFNNLNINDVNEIESDGDSVYLNSP